MWKAPLIGSQYTTSIANKHLEFFSITEIAIINMPRWICVLRGASFLALTVVAKGVDV